MNLFYNHYFGEGPGIPKDVPKPEGLRLLAAVLRREWWDLVKLNVLFIAASLPLVTLPAAWYAATRVCITMIEDRNVYLWRDFWTAFCSRVWCATAAGTVLLAAGALAVLAVASYASAASGNLFYAAPLTISAVVTVLLPLYAAHLFVALAESPASTLPVAMKAATLAMLARPLPGLAALAIVALLWLAHILFYPASVLLPVLVNFSFGALVTAFAVRGGIRFGFSHLAAVSGHGTTRRPKTQSA